MSMQRSLTEVVTTLRQIGEALADNYTPEQFEREVVTYTAHIERTLHYLKLVGIVPKDRSDKNADPELSGIFVPLRIALQDQPTSARQDRELHYRPIGRLSMSCLAWWSRLWQINADSSSRLESRGSEPVKLSQDLVFRSFQEIPYHCALNFVV